ncbi:BTAD domain-containing putative transcriptional regulator [Mycolicibacterium sp. XJ1819]
MELGVLGPLHVRQYGLPVAIPGAKPRAILTMLGLHGGSIVSADLLLELLWGDGRPRTAAKALQTHISALRRALGDGFVVTEGTGWTLATTEIDASRYKAAIKAGREAVAAGDTSQAVARFDEALALWRGVPELPDEPRGVSERTRWLEGHAALVEDRADALLASGRAAEIIGELEAAVADAPLRERRWGQLMLALYRAGRQGEALGAYQRARSLLADELGVDPGPELRRLEAAIVAQDDALEVPVSPQLSVMTRAVTFLLTDIEGSTAAWEADAAAMAVALARHDEIVEQVVTSRGGRLIKTRGEGDATFSVFDRPSSAALAAIELQEAIRHEPWTLTTPMCVRVALHTGEVELRDGDYFGRAVNRAARLRSLAVGGQILCSGATAELVIDSLPEDVVLADLGTRQLRNLARPEHVFELRLQEISQTRAPTTDEPLARPPLPAVLAGSGPFVGRDDELERLLAVWQSTLAAGTRAVLIAGEPGVGKTRLAGEWSRRAFDAGAVVLYGRCDEDLGAPYQPFAEALRSLVSSLGADRLRGLRGIEALLPMVPLLADALPDLAAPHHADPDTERYALFDAVVALLSIAATSAPVVLVLDDLHWAAKPTLLLLRHLLRFGEQARVQVVGTYRSTDLDRSHPLAAMLADLHRDGSADRLALGGLDDEDVTAYVAAAGYDDDELARALSSVTGGNPFFLIEALRHVDESGGHWDPSTLPQGVREAVSRRLSRLPAETNKALAAAAVVGSRFALTLVESVVGDDLVDALDDACKAGIVIEEPGGRYRFNHALVRQSLLAELPSVRRMRLHQRIAATLETEPGADDELLADLAHHYFECAWAGNAAKAVEYCRRAADQAMARLAYEGAADLYDMALHALDELDDELPDRDHQQAELLLARCEALLAAGDVVSAKGAVSQLQDAAGDSARLAAWGTCFDGQLSMLTDPERLDEIESAVAAAAQTLAGLKDAAGEANAHTVRAGCLARLGRIADCETALDQALTAARRAREHRRVNAVLAGAPLAALWGPNPVPRAGGRCLDVVRLLRITTGSPVVEATSTRCQGVLDAFRGRATAGRQLIDSARRTLAELGMRHALLEVAQFAGIVELVADDPAAAEPHLRRAYDGFRRMRLDADTAETAALLARACLALGRTSEADELCTESERLAGHALKASIAWRTVRAQLLARSGAHDEARRVAQEAVAMAERTDALVEHGDACLALATVLSEAGDSTAARVACERALELYERKGAVALADKTRGLLGSGGLPTADAPSQEPAVVLDNACVRALRRLDAAFDREAWDELEGQVAPRVTMESRRKIVGITREELPSDEWLRRAKSYPATGAVRHSHVVVDVRGDRLALTRLEIGTADDTPGAPRDELLQLYGLDENGRIALQVWFDADDMDAAVAELDATCARLGSLDRHAPLENTATRADDHLLKLYAEKRLIEVGSLFTENSRLDDRRRGLRRETNGRRPMVENIRAIAGLGTAITKRTLALRGDSLCLSHVRFDQRSAGPAAFCVEALEITEVDSDGSIVGKVEFDSDDVDAAFAELDARYIAGEAAPYADMWSVITDMFVAHNRREVPATTPNPISVDHRRVAAFAPGEGIDYIRAGWDLDQTVHVYIEALHRVNDLGAVFTWTGRGASQVGSDAEWRGVELVMLQGDLIDRAELFDEADLDTALVRFDRLSRPLPRRETAMGRVVERFTAYFAERDWDAMAEMVSEDFLGDDRRHVVNAGVERGRDTEVAKSRVVADLGAQKMAVDIIATRGERLALCRACISGEDQRPGEFRIEFLGVVEIDTEDRMVARISFDLDDIDAAVAELEARYLAGEAAPYAHTWSVIARNYAAFDRREIPSTTAILDHRRGTSLTSEAARDTIGYIETVHRLTHSGAVVTQVARRMTLQVAEVGWREICLLTVNGEVISGCELFDDTDLVAAIRRFDEGSQSAEHPENMASQVCERLFETFAIRDWAAMADLLAADFHGYDRRSLVDVDLHGPEAVVDSFRAGAQFGIPSASSTVVATRAERLVLTRVRYSMDYEQPDAFQVDLLQLLEIGADERITAIVTFDPDDLEAALTELDARFLAGEAAPHAQMWSRVAEAYAALMRRELPATTPDWVDIDHRRLAPVETGYLAAYVRDAQSLWGAIYIEAVHRLSDAGAVVTRAIDATSMDGFDAEWREIDLLTFEDDRISRLEIFDEADLATAIARFDEIARPAPRPENAATRVYERFNAHLMARNWDAMSALMTDDACNDDRRRVVNAGVQRGRDALLADLRQIVAVGARHHESTVVATRGQSLALTRTRVSGGDQAESFGLEMLTVIEIEADGRITEGVTFDLDDMDAAIEELDARYAAGEALPHAAMWTSIARAYAAFNQHQLPATTPDWVNIDHRRITPIAPGELFTYVPTSWALAPNIYNHIEVVHRLTDRGALLTRVARGTTRGGFNAEWRLVCLVMFEAELLSRVELFDEADLDTAIARFDELTMRVPQLRNTATETWQRLAEAFNRRDLAGFLGLTTADGRYEDRRKGLGDSLEGPARQKVIHAVFETAPSDWQMEVKPIAVRGARLSLTRECYRDTADANRPVAVELLRVMEVGHDDLMHDLITFDPDDLASAVEELDARYLAGATHPVNTATRRRLHVADALNRRDFDGLVALSAAQGCYEDRRKGLRHEARGTELRRVAYGLSPIPTGWALEVIPLAIRGSRVALTRDVFRDTTESDRPITAEHMTLTESDEDGLICRSVLFDAEAVDTAFAELDARYLAGEAAVHAGTWSRITDAYAALNRRELPRTTPDWTSVDHRAVTAFAPGDLAPYICAGWDLGEEFRVDIEAVHRLTDLGGVVTTAARGISRTGFDAEWRQIASLTFEGDRLNRLEVFDEADIAAALTGFDALRQVVPQLVNAATQAWARVVDATNNRDVDGFLAVAAAECHYEDRRKGLRDEGTARPDVVRALFEITQGMRLETVTVAIRGAHLSLTRDTYLDVAESGRPITGEHLTLTEIDDDNLVRTSLRFDPDDIDEAMAELNARWVATGEVAED